MKQIIIRPNCDIYEAYKLIPNCLHSVVFPASEIALSNAMPMQFRFACTVFNHDVLNNLMGSSSQLTQPTHSDFDRNDIGAFILGQNFILQIFFLFFRNGNKMSANSINKFKMNKFYDSYANNDGRVSFEVVDEDRWNRLDSGDDDREPVDDVEEPVDENFNNNNNNDSSSEDEAHVDGNNEQNDDRRTHEPDEIRGSNELPKVSISLLRQSRTSGNIENGSDRGFVGVSFLEADLTGRDRPAADPVSRCNRPSSAAVRAFNVSSLRTNNFKTWQDLEELYGDRTSLTMSNLAALDVQDCMQTHRAVIHEGQSTRRNWSVEKKGVKKPVQRPKSAVSCQIKSAKLCQNKSGSRQKLNVTPKTLSKQSSPGETSTESNKHVMPKINSQEIPDEYSSVVDQETESKDEQSMRVYYFVDKPGRQGSHSQMEGKISKINEQLGDSKLAYQIQEYSVDMKDEGVQVAGLGKPGSAENALLLDLVRDQLQRDEEVKFNISFCFVPIHFISFSCGLNI